jgi:4-amino-4-deoxy-L-arabinose transferase-like glycosyltransferase
MQPRPLITTDLSAAAALPASWQRVRSRHVALLLASFGLVWVTHLLLTSLTPPTDSLEQLIWVHSLQWGYYKHPPLPTWLLWLPVQAFGASATTVSAFGALVTLTSFGVFWLFLRRLRGTAYATIAVLAALCMTYYNGRIDYYNHNVVLLLAAVCAAYACERAFATRQWGWWVALGVAVGLGALSKYMMALVVVAALAVALQLRAWRDRSALRGLLLAGVVALALFAPHAAWLNGRADGPLQYAAQSSLAVDLGPVERMRWSLQWLADQTLNRALPAWLLLAAVLVPWRRITPVPPDAASVRTRAVLLTWGLLPFAFIVALGVVAGADLQLQWGTPFLLFLVPAVMELMPSVSWSAVSPVRLVSVFMVVQILLLGWSQLTSPSGPPRLRDTHWRSLDSRAIAGVVAPPARQALGGPVRVVIGPNNIAGALALRLPERPLVLVDGNYARSPWVPADLVESCGAVEVGRAAVLKGAQPFGSVAPDWAWRIVAPTMPERCSTSVR